MLIILIYKSLVINWWYPWDGTLNDQPHIHLVYWVFIGYIPF